MCGKEVYEKEEYDIHYPYNYIPPDHSLTFPHLVMEVCSFCKVLFVHIGTFLIASIAVCISQFGQKESRCVYFPFNMTSGGSCLFFQSQVLCWLRPGAISISSFDHLPFEEEVPLQN